MKHIFLSAAAIYIAMNAIPAYAAEKANDPKASQSEVTPSSIFKAGKAIPEYGMIAPIDSDMPIADGTKFAVAFDAAKSSEGKENRTLNAAARFINMHVDAGVAAEDIRLSIVVHGSASFDMASDAAYKRKYPNAKENPNKGIIAALQDAGVEIIICGQSAAYHKIAKDDLLPDVKMALSAMTAHALLQQDGYTLNPF